MRIKLVPVLCMLAFMACKIIKKADSVKDESGERIILDEIVVRPLKKADIASYQPAETRIIDLLHTRLELSFDYPKQWVYGKATLSIKPYFHALSAVSLDAKGFTFNKVALIAAKDTIALSYSRDSVRIQIQLPAAKYQTDTFLIYIDYIAKPAELPNETGGAITDSRGIYFINPLGTDPNKPREIWTQGETKYNSCWFPTNDAPNEKHTQDLFITVDSKDVTLSNGLLIDSRQLKNGQRTDHWQQLKPHAPYLTMLAVGEFKITKDQWHGKEVSYYLEAGYAPYAKTIFGKTPQMMETFSRLTGVDYPWDKFSQVVCRDFVSGAMENTSAVVHAEQVQHDVREHLDDPHEDVIVHELFHHWFGDYVTCRSWSNLPLNESFATYGEYLWNEATYGKLFADKVFSRSLDAYIYNRGKHWATPIRNYYTNPDDVFDVVSYQKGGWIIHNLRYLIGDPAFFKGLNLYLTNNKFGTADIHDLRHAMEQASGEDLNVFFNQWFLGKGHPELELKYYFDQPRHKLMVEIKQVQDSSFGVFAIATQLNYAFNDTVNRGIDKIHTLNLQLRKRYELIAIDYDSAAVKTPGLALFYLDPKGVLLATIDEAKPAQTWLSQLFYGESYLVKQRAMRELMGWQGDSLIYVKQAIEYLLGRPEDFYQVSALNLLSAHSALYEYFEYNVLAMVNSAHVKVRNEAIKVLGRKRKDVYLPAFIDALHDSSYGVISASLVAIWAINEDTATALCLQLEGVENGLVQKTVADIYRNAFGVIKNAYFKRVLGKYGIYRNSILDSYANYLKEQDDAVILEAIPILENYYALNSDVNKAALMQHAIRTIQKGIGAEKAETEKPVRKQLRRELERFEKIVDQN